MGVMPMFPLGCVLFPSVVLPLHVFEPRYRQLTRDVLAGDGEFGVVLIERGHEVGGGDVRTDVGTVARVVEAAELPDGRWALQCIGTRRLRVDRWLDDDPYPRAQVRDEPDPEPTPAAAELLAGGVRLLRRCLALANELGDTGLAATVELSEDPALGSHQLAAVAPVSTIDKQRLLAAPTVEERIVACRHLLEDAMELLELRLRGPGGDPV